jgi:hypothetical protein
VNNVTYGATTDGVTTDGDIVAGDTAEGDTEPGDISEGNIEYGDIRYGAVAATGRPGHAVRRRQSPAEHPGRNSGRLIHRQHDQAPGPPWPGACCISSATDRRSYLASIVVEVLAA